MIEGLNITRKFVSGEEVLYAVKDITLKVKKGEFVAITGRSGSGKSTLMYQLSLLDRPSEGRVVIDDVDVTNFSAEERTKIRLNDLGYVFQDYALIPELNALENVVVPLLMQNISTEEAYAQAKQALENIGLGDRIDHLPSELSGGQQQRVSIARAMAHEPKVIFADEPTANLDSESSKLVLENFLKLNKAGQTIIMVTHEKEYARVADRVIVLSDGVIESDSTKAHHK